jgi:hypothetical protein
MDMTKLIIAFRNFAKAPKTQDRELKRTGRKVRNKERKKERTKAWP